VNQKVSEQNEVDGMKKGADSTGKVMHMRKSGWRFVMRQIRVFKRCIRHSANFHSSPLAGTFIEAVMENKFPVITMTLYKVAGVLLMNLNPVP